MYIGSGHTLQSVCPDLFFYDYAIRPVPSPYFRA